MGDVWPVACEAGLVETSGRDVKNQMTVTETRRKEGLGRRERSGWRDTAGRGRVGGKGKGKMSGGCVVCVSGRHSPAGDGDTANEHVHLSSL
jgi:hypothetical protein